jgi:hypothetical protein
MKTLDEIGLQYRTDKSSPYHNYLNTYEKYFKEFRDKSVVELWELGIGDINSANREGESAFVWRDYFTNCPTIRVFDNDLVKVNGINLLKPIGISAHHLDQTDEQGFHKLLEKVARPFIIIDDASHVQKNTIQSFEILFPLLQPWPDWGGNLNVYESQPLTIMGYMLGLCHQINLKRQETFNPPLNLSVSDMVKQIDSIHFHHSQIIIRKK